MRIKIMPSKYLLIISISIYSTIVIAIFCSCPLVVAVVLIALCMAHAIWFIHRYVLLKSKYSIIYIAIADQDINKWQVYNQLGVLEVQCMPYSLVNRLFSLLVFQAMAPSGAPRSSIFLLPDSLNLAGRAAMYRQLYHGYLDLHC
jgi:hypothetical protein